MKNENKKMNNKELISAYNKWVQEQENFFKKSDSFCCYFYIDSDTLNKIPPEHNIELEKIKEQSSRLATWQLWDKILSKNLRKYKPTNKDKILKKIKQKIKFKPKKLLGRGNPQSIFFTTKLHQGKDFISLCRQKGLYVPPYQFRWYEDNKIIYPLLKWKGKNYYSIFQIYILDYIEIWKEETLGYPNPTYHPAPEIGWIKTKPVLWQDYLLWNKENITIKGSKWNEIVKILLDIKDLFNIFFDETFKEVEKLKKEGQNKKFLFRDIFNNLIFNTGNFYAQKIRKAHPEISEAIIRYWIEICASQIERLNPFFKKSKEHPFLLKLFKESKWLMPTAGFSRTRRNEIQLANFYWRIIDYLTFYLECLTGEKELSIEELTSSGLKRQEKICEICGDKFIPNPKRTGGIPQKLCGKESCNKEWARRLAKEYRKKKKLKSK